MKDAKQAFIAILLLISGPVHGQLVETRYCGEPKRNAQGNIIRRADVMAHFQMIHPCPSTGLRTGACPGWAKDHVIPLACGGCDSVANMQWLPDALKSMAGTVPKDRWERKIYSATPQIPGTPACILSLPVTP